MVVHHQNDVTSPTKVTKTTRLIAASVAAFLEIVLFHPFDTIAKRLMSFEKPVWLGSISKTATNINEIVFRKLCESPPLTKLQYLYNGFGFAVTYKALQRVYKLGGQPIVRDFIGNFDSSQKTTKDSRNRVKHVLIESFAGSLIGIGEVILLPIDRLKVLAQTNEAVLQNRSLVNLVTRQLPSLYSGAMVTAGRNCVGSFFLFGGTAFTKEILNVEDHRKATVWQNMIASAVGSFLSIISTNPMDLVKTRIQNKEIGVKLRAHVIVRDVIRSEGVGAFLKGVTPKLIVSAPKFSFAYTVTEYLTQVLSRRR